MSGFGELSVRRREREERVSSGLDFKRHILLVLTPTRLLLFDARSQMTRWKANRLLDSWERSAIQATADTRSVTIRLTLEIPSESRRVELEAPKARSSTAGQVAGLLARDRVPPRADVLPPPARRMSPAERAEAERMRKVHNRPGWLAIVGGGIRLIAYVMPWIVITPPTGSRYALDISGWTALAGPWLSVVYPVGIIVAGCFYLAGRREASPRMIWSLGIGSSSSSRCSIRSS